MFENYKRDFSTHLILLFVSIIWGTSWAAARILSNGFEDNPATMGPATSAWIRYLSVVIIFYIWYLYKFFNRQNVRFLPPNKSILNDMFVLGLFGVMIYQLLFMHGMKWTAAGDASVIMPINPIFTALLAFPLLGQKITKNIFYGMIISIIGVIIIVGWSPNTDIALRDRMLGDFMILIAAFSWALCSIITKKTMIKNIKLRILPSEIVIWYSLLGWIMLTPWMVMEIISNGIIKPNFTEIIIILYLGIFSTVLANVWFAIGIEKIGPTSTSAYIFLVPVFGILSGWIILGENIGLSMILGFILIVGGVRKVQIDSSRLNSSQ
ncbi:MAG: DMT family transporter [Candidatus Thalassarchaeaceae archaeon]|nr:DMT family transporter [Candidatus Thalassarchaeaceae archaeon]